MTPKIDPRHLQRQAYVYLRQSSPGQVENHQESTERQYELADRAVELGWDRSQVLILDRDLGRSGATAEGRDDFHRLMAAVGFGEVGAVFALEAARLSRSQADWHKLLDVCALTDTLLIDHDGIYDPNDFNDRLLLGFKGAWSHTELHAMRIRLQGAKLHKARKGELRCTPPTGYLYDPSGALILDPDESVTSSIRLLFQQFKALGSAYGVMRFFAQHQLAFPRRIWAPGSHGCLEWGPLSLGRILAILHNPTYAGAYVYGRRQSRPVLVEGRPIRVRTLQRPREEWTVLIQDAHPAYIGWEDYLENERQLSRNRTDLQGDSRQGAPRQGAALLQGLLLCGRCGRRMTVRYQGTAGKRAFYPCDRRRFQDGQAGVCWSVPAAPIDAAVENHLLHALTQDNLDISLAVLQQMEQEVRELDRHWQLQIERACYEVQRAQRQYDAVDPENRLVARTLEKRWNEKLQQREEIEQAYAQACRTQPLALSPQQRQQILRLASDLPALWKAPTTTQAERKELLGLLIKQIALTPVDVPQRRTHVQILWHTEAVTELWVARPDIKERFRTPSQVVEAVARLTTGRRDDEIAAILNDQGLRSGRDNSFTAASVAWIRYKHGIRKPGSDPRVAAHTEARPDGRFSTRGLAKRLGVTIYTIHYWRKHGIIPAIQETRGGPWWHEATPEALAALRERIRRVPLRPDFLSGF